jgi:hypothetical protein
MAHSWHTQSELVTLLAQHIKHSARTDRVVRDVTAHEFALTMDY